MQVLIAIDIQKGFLSPYWGQRNNPSAEEVMAAALAKWRAHGRTLVHVQHLSTNPASPLYPEKEGVQLMDFACPQVGEKLVQKQVNSAFIGTDLLEYLRRIAATELTFIGFTTDHCVSTSTRMAANHGFRCRVVEDATVAHDRYSSTGERLPAALVHEYALASLRDEFAEIIRSSALL
jgi:nicotinamidase-related amidase